MCKKGKTVSVHATKAHGWESRGIAPVALTSSPDRTDRSESSRHRRFSRGGWRKLYNKEYRYFIYVVKLERSAGNAAWMLEKKRCVDGFGGKASVKRTTWRTTSDALLRRGIMRPFFCYVRFRRAAVNMLVQKRIYSTTLRHKLSYRIRKGKWRNIILTI